MATMTRASRCASVTEPLRSVRDHLGAVAALTGCRAAQRYGARTWTAEWLGQLRAHDAEPEREVPTALESVGD